MAERKEIVCETVEVTARDMDGNVTEITVPAFTVDHAALKARVEDLLEKYLEKSGESNGVSLGDFALYLLALSSLDPREQDA